MLNVHAMVYRLTDSCDMLSLIRASVQRHPIVSADASKSQCLSEASRSTVKSRYLKVDGIFFKSSNYPKCKLIFTSGNLDL